MEGEGIAAVVQGLQDCVLAVTMVNKQHFVNSLNSNSQNSGSSTSPHAKEIPDRGPVMNTAAQITDGRYASTYQVAHCNVRPTAPRDYVTEFPPQRLEPCPNQGNFQIGTGGYMDPETSRARNRSYYDRSSPLGYSWLNDRSSVSPARLSPTRQHEIPTRMAVVQPGSLSPNGHSISPAGHVSRSSHQSPSGRVPRSGRMLGWTSPIPGSADFDQFPNSLRRYPLVSSDRNGSAELVQKLLNYTQNKHLSKISVQKRRSTQERPTRDVMSKNIQTYTRNKSEPTRDPGPTTTNKLFSPYRSTSPLTSTPIKRSISTKKATSPKRSFSSKRSISSRRSTSPKRSTSPTRSVSPKKSISPKRSISPKGSISSIRINSPDTSSMPYSATYDYLNPGRGKRVEVRYLDDVRKCIRDTLKQIYDDTASCSKVEERYSRHRRIFHDDDNDKGLGTEAEDTDKADRGQETERQPQRNGFFPDKTSVPQGLGTMSSSELVWADDDDDDDDESSRRVPGKCVCTKIRWPCICSYTSKDSEKVKLGAKIAEEIFNWVNDLPVYANETRDDAVKREAMIMDLVYKLKRIIGDPDFENNAKQLITKCIEKLPIWYPGGEKDKETFKNQITDELVDKLNNIVDKLTVIISKWLKGLEFTENVNKGEVVKNIAKRIKPLADRSEDMETEIKDIIQDLPILNKTEDVEKMSGKLVADLTSVAADIVLEKEIKKWLDNTPELLNGANNIRNANLIAKKIKQAVDREPDDSNYQEVVRKVVDDWIEDITRNGNYKLASRTKANLADQLVEKLKIQEKIKPVRRDRPLANQKDNVDFIWNWLANNDVIPDEHRIIYKELVNNLAKKLQKMQSSGARDEEIAKEIMIFLDNLIKEGETIVDKDKLAKKLVQDLKRNSKQPCSIEQYEDRTSEWLADVVGIPEEQMEKYKDPVKDFAKKLQNLQSIGAGEDDITEKILNFLDFLTEKGVPVDKKNKMAKQLIKDLKKTDKNPNLLKQYEGDIREEKIAKYKDPVKVLAKNLQELQSKGAGEDEISKEIMNFLNYLPEVGEKIVDKDKLAKKLVQDLKRNSKKPRSIEQYEDRTSEWLADVVGIPEEQMEKYKDPVKDFAKKLQNLHSIGAGEDEITEKILNFLDFLTEKGVPVGNKNKVAKQLIKDLKKTDIKPNLIKQYEGDIREEELAKNLHELQSKGAGEDEISQEIMNFLNYLPEVGEKIVDKDKLAKKLVQDLKRNSKQPSSIEQYEDRTTEWLADVVGIPEEQMEKYKDPVKDFAKKLQNLQSIGAGEDDITEKILNFLDFLTEKGVPVGNKNKVAKQLIKDLKKTDKKPNLLKQYEDRTLEWLSEVVDRREEKIAKYKDPVKVLAKNLQELQSKGAEEDEISKETMNFLNYLTEVGETIINKDKLSKNLVNNLKEIYEQPISLEQYEDRSSERLKDVVDIPKEHVEKYKGPDLAKKLQKLQSRGAEDDEIAKEIVTFLDSFTEKGETVVNKDKLAKKLVRDLKINSEQPNSIKQHEEWLTDIVNVYMPEEQLEKCMEWLSEVVDMPEEKIAKYKCPVKVLAKKIIELQSEGAGEDEISEEIMNFLNFLTEEGETIVNKDKLAKNLMKSLKKSSENPSLLEQCEDRTSKWLSDIVDIPDENREKYKGVVKDLAKKLQELVSIEADDDEIAEEIKKIYNFITNDEETVVQKDNVAQNLMEDILSLGERNKDTPKSKKRNSKSDIKFSKKKGQGVKSSGTSGDESAGEKLAKKLLRDKKTTVRKFGTKEHEDRNQELLKEKVDTPKVRSKKSKGYNTSLNKKMQGLRRNSRTSDEETTDGESVVKKHKTAQNLSKDPKTDRKPGLAKQNENNMTSNILSAARKQSIMKEISGLIGDIPTNKSNQNELKNDIADILTQNFNDLLDKTKKKSHQDIKKLLMKVAKMSDEDASKIASAIINRVNGMPFPKTSTDQRRYSESINNDNIHDIIKEFDIHPNLKTDLVKTLKDFFTDEEATGTLETEKTKHDLSRILQNAGLSATDANDMAERLRTNKNLPLRAQNSELTKRSTLTPMEISSIQRENFVEIAKKEITDFVNDILKDDSPEARKVLEEKIGKLAEILGEIKSDPTVKDKKKAALGHISDFLNDIPLKTITPTAELTKLLADRIFNFVFQNSTPKKEGFLTNKPDFDNSSINYEEDSVENPLVYMNQLIDIIKAWIDEVSPNKVGRAFKNKIARELAADIFNRQKYLQLNPEIKTSNEQELARLQYEVHRIANQTLSGDDLTFVIRKVDDLMKQIETLKKPNFVTTTEKVVTSQRSSIDTIDTAYQSTSVLVLDGNEIIKENLKGGVQDWLRSLLLYERANSKVKRELENMIPRLVSAITSVTKNARTAEEAGKRFTEEIVKQLKKSAIEPELKSDETFLRNSAEALLENLNELQLLQDISHRQETTTDPLQAILDDWVGSLPIKRLNSSEATTFEKQIKDLASKLKQIRKIEPNNDEKIKKIIQQNLLKFPIEESTKQNQNFITEKVENLFRNLLIVPIKNSGPKSKVNKKGADILFDAVEDYCEKLPFESTLPQAKQEIAKKEIANKLINKIGELNMNPEVFNDEFLYNQMFEDELDTLLADIFSGDDKKNLPALKNNFLDKVKEARQKTQEEIAGQTYKHQLRNTISKNLPFTILSAEEKAAFEAVKDFLVDAFINLHYVGDNEEQKQKYKTDIKKELSKFCDDYLKNHGNVPLDTVKLNENLYQALRAVPIPKDETLIPEVELAKVKEDVNKWVKELPLWIQTGDEKLKVDKLAAVLAKKIRDIEKQNELEHNTDFNDVLTKPIKQWMDKLLEHLDENTKYAYANKLVDNLGKTRQSRRVSADMRRSIDAEFFDGTLNKSISCIERCKLPCSIKPNGTLSIEDAQHLEKIRARAKSTQQKNTGSQTATPPCEKSGYLMQEAGSSAEVVPRLIVKEYYWDTASSQFVESQSPCSREYPPCSPISSRCPISPSCSMKSPCCSPAPGSCIMQHRLWSPPCSNARLGSPKHTALSQRPLETDPRRRDNIPASYQNQPRYEQSPPLPDLSQRRPCRRLPDDHEPCSPCPFGITESSPETPPTSYHRPEISSAERHVPYHCRGRCAKTMPGVDYERPCRKFRGDRDFWRERHDDCGTAQPYGKRTKPEGFCRGNSKERNEEMKACSKCCGIHCPFPSYMYFK